MRALAALKGCSLTISYTADLIREGQFNIEKNWAPFLGEKDEVSRSQSSMGALADLESSHSCGSTSHSCRKRSTNTFLDLLCGLSTPRRHRTTA